MIFVGIALAVLASCAALRKALDRPEREEREVWNGRIRITALQNDGAAFGLPLPRQLVMAVSAVLMSALAFCGGYAPVGVGLALGGGISNLLERLRSGSVYDYLQFPRLPGRWRRYVLNLADLAIFLGAVLILFHKEKPSGR